MYLGDSHELLSGLPDGSINLVVTSPPYALHFKKEYGNADKQEYVEWLRPFAREIFRVLTDDGSFVLNIGGSYNAGSPTRSLYHFRALLMLCDDIGFHLAQECFWYNPEDLRRRWLGFEIEPRYVNNSRLRFGLPPTCPGTGLHPLVVTLASEELHWIPQGPGGE
jgi:DNA modification methylase